MKLDQFRRKKGWSYVKLAEMVGASHATVVRRWCLPLTHPDRMIPSGRFMMNIMTVTEGEVQPNSFYRTAADD